MSDHRPLTSCSPARSGPHHSEPHEITSAISQRIDRELLMSSDDLGLALHTATFDETRSRADGYLQRINHHLHSGEINPHLELRTSAGEGRKSPVDRLIRVGVYPVTGNPLHWGHLLAGLEAIAELQLDKVLYLVQGIDLRKPCATSRTQGHRHRMAQRVLRILDPLAAYSKIGKGTSLVGEENLFQLLQLNPRQRIAAHYIIGGDHYRLTDEVGCPDTIPRIESQTREGQPQFNFRNHSVSVAVIGRGVEKPQVPTSLQVSFLPPVLDVSSTAVRAGNVSYTPNSAVRYLRQHPSYARSIGLSPEAIRFQAGSAR